MKRDTKEMMNAFGKAMASRLGFLEEVSTSRREFLRNSSLMAAGFAAASMGGAVIAPRIARA